MSSTNILALDTLLAMISALESTTNNDANGSMATHGGGGGEEGGGEKGGATSMSQSAGIIFSSAKVEEREGEGEVGGAVSEPNLLKEKEEERVERLILPTSPGTLSELLKARQLKKVSILFYYLNLYLSLSLLLVDHSWY